MSQLDDLLQRLMDQPPEIRAAIENEVLNSTSHLKWVPNPGPQTDAYHSEADILLYGGAAGGGKTDLVLGLAFNEHNRALICRRQYTDLGSITDRAIQINGSRAGYNGSPPPKLRVDGNLIEFGAAKDAEGSGGWQGQPHDLLAFDEAAQFAEKQVRYLMGWVRTTKKGQRCRVILASNPPLSDEGSWLIRMFAPWLDQTYHNPAEPGELRWFVTDENDEDREVDGPGPHQIAGRSVRGKSRTFIPAKVQDNPYLANTEYQDQLASMPEPYRSALLDGKFTLGLRDHDLQVIPSEWIRAAQARWTPDPPDGVPMCVVSADPAQGPGDAYEIAYRHGGWYAPIVSVPKKENISGREGAGRILANRSNDALVVVDMGGGYGGPTFEHLKDNKIPVKAYKGAEKSHKRTRDGRMGFYNVRAATYWGFREALDPNQFGGSRIALPPDPELYSDLASIRLDDPDPALIKLEPKKKLISRIGRSPGKGDAVVMAWAYGPKAFLRGTTVNSSEQGFVQRRSRQPQAKLGYEAARRAARR